MGALQARMQASAETAAVNTANQYANEQIHYRFPWCQKVEQITKILGTATVVSKLLFFLQKIKRKTILHIYLIWQTITIPWVTLLF